MQVERNDLNEIFKALGKPTAHEWPRKRFAEKVTQLPELAEAKPDAVTSMSDSLQEVLAGVTAALADNEGVEVTYPEEETANANAAKVKAKKKAKKGADPEKEAKEQRKKKAAKEAAGRPPQLAKAESKDGKGVIATIIDVLKEANVKEPVTRDDILKKLVKKFPKRDPKSMRVTVISQVPLRIKKRGENLRSSPKGYWISKGHKKVERVEGE